MKRFPKSIKTLDEIADKELFQVGIDLPELQHQLRQGDNRARVLCEMASLTKRMINEGVAFEDLLSQKGILNLSAAFYAVEWSVRYYDAAKREQDGYWRRLWRALLNK